MVKIIEGKKTVPMIGHFISLTSLPILLQIACIRACSKAKMTLYNINYLYTFMYFIWIVTTQSFQNCQTLGQFFDPLYLDDNQLLKTKENYQIILITRDNPTNWLGLGYQVWCDNDELVGIKGNIRVCLYTDSR